MSYDQFIYQTTLKKIVHNKTSKPGKLRETVKVLRNFDLNGKPYLKGNVIEIEVGHILTKAIKRGNVELLKQD